MEREWAAVLAKAGVSVFHTVDCAHQKGEFQSKSREECSAIYQTLLGLIRRHAARGVAAMVNFAAFDSLKPPGWEALFGGAYALCATLCLQSIGRWCGKKDSHERIAYFFEDGHSEAREAA